MVKIILLFISFLYFISPITAQLSVEDSLFYQKVINNAVAQYRKSLTDQPGLFNGRQYAGYPSAFKDGAHPFFYASAPTKGSIVYDNVSYHEAQLLYDEIAEVIVIQEATRRIQLHSDWVSRFSIFNKNFIRIVKDSTAQALISTGFYNVLYEGNVSVLKREIKSWWNKH